MSVMDWFVLLEKEFKRHKTVVHVISDHELQMMNSLRRLARKAGYTWRFRREPKGVIVRKV